MEDVVVKLGDFGLSTFVDDEKAPSTYVGTIVDIATVSFSIKIFFPQLSIVSQEITGYRQVVNHWTKMCDVFSLGCKSFKCSATRFLQS